MRKIFPLIFFFFLPIPLHANDSLSKLEKQIQKDGAYVVLERIWNTKVFGEVLDGIASGNKRYITVGLKLREVSDAGSTSMLREAFAMALITNPSDVLSYQKSGRLGFSIDELCGTPFIDEPEMGFREYYKAARKAVTRIEIANIDTVKMRCLAKMKHNEDEYTNR